MTGARLRHYYRSWVPHPLRVRLDPLSRSLATLGSPRRVADTLAWRLLGAETLRRRTDARLALGPYYWLFILGLNNSGTTLLVRILSSHPLIRTMPREGQYLTRALPHPMDVGVRRLWSARLDLFRLTEDGPAAPALRVQYDWARAYPRRPGVLLEKSPVNCVRSRWLQRHFRPSRFIAIVRDPYAVCEGIRRREGHSIEEAARHWSRAHGCLLDDMEHLEHRLLVRYEDLCARPEAELVEIERFLGLAPAFDRAVLQSSFAVHSVEGLSSGIQDFNAESLRRLSPQDIETITRITAPERERLGYRPPAAS